jgi:hypothetical protein
MGCKYNRPKEDEEMRIETEYDTKFNKMMAKLKSMKMAANSLNNKKMSNDVDW